MRSVENLQNSKRKQFSTLIIKYLFIINGSRDSEIMAQ
jgi:hypothetical protein